MTPILLFYPSSQYSDTDQSESESSDAYELDSMANDQALLTEMERKEKKRRMLTNLAEVCTVFPWDAGC